MKKFDVIVIGGGPGGYVCAIRASQRGFKVAVVEKENLGGVCLNWGCIPTKSLLKNAEAVATAQQGDVFGFTFDKSTFHADYGAAQKRSRQVSQKLADGVGYLMKKNKIEVIRGTAKFLNSTQISIAETKETIEAKNIVIATGSHANAIPAAAPDGKLIITAREALTLTSLPQNIIVVGAGAIGMEFSSIWNTYGAKVTVVEMMDTVLPLEDVDVSRQVGKEYVKAGIKICTKTKVEKVEKTAKGVRVTTDAGGKKEINDYDLMLICAGVKPNSEGLGLEKAGVAVNERGYIKIDDQMRTSAKNIYAIGDVTGKMPLAHVASAQGIIAADAMAKKPTTPLVYANMPRCTYGRPEAASVGLTQKQAKEQGYDVACGTFPFSANGKALGLGEAEGFVKIVSEKKYGQILGVHMTGPHVTELLAGPTGLISLEATLEELSHIVHPHPTLSEAIMEASHVAEGMGIHI